MAGLLLPKGCLYLNLVPNPFHVFFESVQLTRIRAYFFESEAPIFINILQFGLLNNLTFTRNEILLNDVHDFRFANTAELAVVGPILPRPLCLPSHLNLQNSCSGREWS